MHNHAAKHHRYLTMISIKKFRKWHFREWCQHHSRLRRSSVSPIQSTTSKTSKTQHRFLCPTHQDTREIHTPVHQKWGGGGSGTQRVSGDGGTRQVVPVIPSPFCDGWACGPREPSDSRSAHVWLQSPVSAPPVATGNQAAALAGFIPPVTAAPTLQPLPLTCSPWRRQLQTRQTRPPRWFPTLSSTTLHRRSSAQDAGGPRCHGGAHHPSRTGGSISSRKAHANLEAQPAPSSRGGGGWEAPIFKRCQRQLGLGLGAGMQTWDTVPPTGKRKASTYQFAELLESKKKKCVSREKNPWSTMKPHGNMVSQK